MCVFGRRSFIIANVIGETNITGLAASDDADVGGAHGSSELCDAVALCNVGGLRGAVRSSVPVSAPGSASSVRLPDEDYLRMALDEARRAESLGEVPIGAVVVHEPIDPATRRPLAQPRVIARACNLRETTRDPAGHAEFLAMKEAARVLGAWRLAGCTVYVTLEPCIMCAGLMHQARIDRCVYGASDPKAGALGTLYSVHSDSRLNHTFDVRAGVLEDECASIMRSFFAKKRANKRKK